MNRPKIISVTDKAILILLTIQISFVSISIALSSIAFGIWLGLWLIQTMFAGKADLDRDLFRDMRVINIFIILYCLSEIISRFFAVYPEGAFSNLKRLLLFLIFYAAIIKVPDLRTLCRILLTILCAVSLISVYELIQYAFKFGELISRMPFSEIRIDYLSYPLTAAEIKMMVLFSMFPLLFIKEQFIISRKYLAMIFIPVILSMILTQSRNVMLASFICFLIFGIAVNRKFLLAFAAVIVLSWIILPSDYSERVKSIVDMSHPSNESRLDMWKVGIEMFKDHPVTGVADSHIREIYETYKKPEKQGEGVHLHNNFIMILATTGVPGFISFLGMFISIFLMQIKFYKRDGTGIYKTLVFGSILVMISFQISGIFEWSFGDHEVMTVFFFLISIPFILNKFELNETDESRSVINL